jgi:hypothetical protein
MQDSNSLIQHAAQEIEALSKTSPTAAGRNNQSAKPAAATSAHIDALNETFALFRINYHNQYYKAYSDEGVLSQIKKLWLESLSSFAPQTILRGARKVIEESEYLPTLHRMIRACQGNPEQFGLPDAHTAYLEACRAPSPKAAQPWSHAAVYHAGLASDWFFLTSNSEKMAFPVFERHYLRLCEKVMNGTELPAPNIPVLTDTIETPLTKEENQKRLEILRKQLDI